MNDRDDRHAKLGHWLIPVLLLHVVCCGGLVLFSLAGSAALVVTMGYLSDPLVQGAGLLVLVAGSLWLWRRWRIKCGQSEPGACRVEIAAVHPQRREATS